MLHAMAFLPRGYKDHRHVCSVGRRCLNSAFRTQTYVDQTRLQGNYVSPTGVLRPGGYA